MKLYIINNTNDLAPKLKQLNVDGSGVKIMADKANVLTIMIKNLHVGAANILKQDALSIGADLAVPNGTITCEFKQVDAILIASIKHLKILARKELAQPYGLKDVANELKKIVATYDKKNTIKIMGIINANDDSFFSGSRFQGKSALSKIEEIINDGADIIDIGGVSSRPNSAIVTSDEEMQRVKPIIDEIYASKLHENITISLDTYAPEVAQYGLDKGVQIINDITGLSDDSLAKIVAQYNATVVIMHMLGTPQTMQNNPQYDNVILDIKDFFTQRIEKAKEFGIEKIILDVGIGFGKSLDNNIDLIKNLEAFKTFGYELLVGASRKSLIDKIITTPIEERLPGTLALHLESIRNGASIIRVHDVKEHYQALKVFDKFNQL